MVCGRTLYMTAECVMDMDCDCESLLDGKFKSDLGSASTASGLESVVKSGKDIKA